MEVAIIIIVSILFSFGSVVFIKNYYRSQQEKTKHKFSDAEIFKLMARANHFLTDKQLAAVSPLDIKEAKNRLMHLSMQGILRRFNDGGVNSVYQLKEELPEHKSLPISIQGLSDRQIVDVALKYSDDYQITIAKLVVVFGIDVVEAKNVLKRLTKSGLVTRLWKGMSIIYVIKDPIQQSTPRLKTPGLKIPSLAANMGTVIPEQQGKLKIPDADVLSLAIENKGRLTVTFLCLKLNISMNEAKIKLEELYDQGVFIMDVDEGNGVLEYQLRDKSLLL